MGIVMVMVVGCHWSSSSSWMSVVACLHIVSSHTHARTRTRMHTQERMDSLEQQLAMLQELVKASARPQPDPFAPLTMGSDAQVRKSAHTHIRTHVHTHTHMHTQGTVPHAHTRTHTHVHTYTHSQRQLAGLDMKTAAATQTEPDGGLAYNDGRDAGPDRETVERFQMQMGQVRFGMVWRCVV